MTNFERALADYRNALQTAGEAAATEVENFLYRILAKELRHIEQLYAETRDPNRCRISMESEPILHRGDILTGVAVPPLRDAFERLFE